jgi:hypothetical protein
MKRRMMRSAASRPGAVDQLDGDSDVDWTDGPHHIAGSLAAEAVHGAQAVIDVDTIESP